MLTGIDINTVRFGEPHFLWLLLVPAALLVIWVWQFGARRRDARRFRQHRRLPVRERFPILGGLVFWLSVIFASTFAILALSRPTATVSVVRTAGVDLVILQDGSASMRTKDVAGDRWQRSMTFLRTLGESLAWRDDRIAMALFAHIAAPQVRLTKAPNTFFFFLDHLSRESPGRIARASGRARGSLLAMPGRRRRAARRRRDVPPGARGAVAADRRRRRRPCRRLDADTLTPGQVRLLGPAKAGHYRKRAA